MKKILIVEDEDLNLDLLIQLLEERYELITAKDGASAVDLASREKPDLILMDMRLPVMDGWEATRRIKTGETTGDIPVIGLSSHAMTSDTEKAFAAGCDEYMTKPLDEDWLFEKLEGLLGE
jgi:CheY-like chemotaxis protein